MMRPGNIRDRSEDGKIFVGLEPTITNSRGGRETGWSGDAGSKLKGMASRLQLRVLLSLLALTGVCAAQAYTPPPPPLTVDPCAAQANPKFPVAPDPKAKPPVCPPPGSKAATPDAPAPSTGTPSAAEQFPFPGSATPSAPAANGSTPGQNAAKQ